MIWDIYGICKLAYSLNDFANNDFKNSNEVILDNGETQKKENLSEEEFENNKKSSLVVMKQTINTFVILLTIFSLSTTFLTQYSGNKIGSFVYNTFLTKYL